MAQFEGIDSVGYASALRRGREARRTKAIAVRYEPQAQLIVVSLHDGRAFTLKPNRLPGLASASPHLLSDVRVEGTGSTLHFPALDADFSIDRLIEDVVAPSDWTTKAVV